MTESNQPVADVASVTIAASATIQTDAVASVGTAEDMSPADPVQATEESGVSTQPAATEPGDDVPGQDLGLALYRIRFREYQHIQTASARIRNLAPGELVMVQTDHGPEPAMVFDRWVMPPPSKPGRPPAATHSILRRASREEVGKYESLLVREKDAARLCRERIGRLGLDMDLVMAERHFNGGKVIFYFTAENRVDFRELVKELVQEFRTRIEMRQIGVRHETKMVGGLGSCGRELCCCSFMSKFLPVSIKMAKEQDLPLNPAKISGICNRLLCCLNHEYEAYRQLKKDMPKTGKSVLYQGRLYKVVKSNALMGTVTLMPQEGGGEFLSLDRTEWVKTEPARKPEPPRKGEGQPRKGEGGQGGQGGRKGEESRPKGEEQAPPRTEGGEHPRKKKKPHKDKGNAA